MAVAVSEARKDRLRQLAAAHDAWTAKQLADAPFHPEDHSGSRDYNLHYVDLEASPEAQLEWLRTSGAIMGINFGSAPGA